QAYVDQSVAGRKAVADELRHLSEKHPEDEKVREWFAMALFNQGATDQSLAGKKAVADELRELSSKNPKEKALKLWLAWSLVLWGELDARVMNEPYRSLASDLITLGWENPEMRGAAACLCDVLSQRGAKRWEDTLRLGVPALKTEERLPQLVRRAVRRAIRHVKDKALIEEVFVKELKAELATFLASDENAKLFGSDRAQQQIFEQAVVTLEGLGAPEVAWSLLQKYRGVSAYKLEFQSLAQQQGGNADQVIARLTKQRSQLESQTLVLEYLVSEEKTVVFASSRDGFTTVDCTHQVGDTFLPVGTKPRRKKGERTLEREGWMRLLDPYVPTDYPGLGATLIPEDLHEVIKSHDHVVICATGDLHSFPFTLLPQLADKKVSRASSLSEYLRSVEKEQTAKGERTYTEPVMAWHPGNENLATLGPGGQGQGTIPAKAATTFAERFGGDPHLAFDTPETFKEKFNLGASLFVLECHHLPSGPHGEAYFHLSGANLPTSQIPVQPGRSPHIGILGQDALSRW
nr:hypothetical protein [Fimbriimonadaceae bacterium]